MKNPKNIPRFRFTQDEPTPIVRDFNTFVSYLENTSFALGESDLDLLVNQSILYLFDFGDEWTFDVKLLEIRTDEPLLPEAKITKRKGRSPEQYPRYDDF